MTTKKLIVVIATYNEKENLPDLVQKVLEGIPAASIVVVDDNSPDGTGVWCKEMAEQEPRLFHIGRAGKLGLGSATLEGFRFAIEQGFEFIGTMDADFSHNPDSLIAMWDKVEADLGGREKFGAIIGSRYIPNGGIEGWPLSRRIASKCVNWFTRLMLRVPTKDNTGAFRIYKAAALTQANIMSITTSGYAYLEEIIYRLHKSGFELNEHPITFVDRQKGKSKASIKEGLSVFSKITKLAFTKLN